MLESPSLFCLYAEDVRQETNGQLSIIGVFQGGLVVPSVPTTIPKFAIVANLRVPALKDISTVTLEVRRGSDVLQTLTPPPEFLKEASSRPEKDVTEGDFIQFVIGFNGFPVLAEGKLEVHAKLDGTDLRGNSLRINAGSGAQQAPVKMRIK